MIQILKHYILEKRYYQKLYIIIKSMKSSILYIIIQCLDTYNEAMNSKDSKEWNLAIKNEIKNMDDKKCYDGG